MVDMKALPGKEIPGVPGFEFESLCCCVLLVDDAQTAATSYCVIIVCNLVSFVFSNVSCLRQVIALVDACMTSSHDAGHEAMKSSMVP